MNDNLWKEYKKPCNYETILISVEKFERYLCQTAKNFEQAHFFGEMKLEIENINISFF